MSEIELPSGWHRLSQEAAEQFEAELQRELCPNHVLYRVSVQALARLERRDDFLFRIPDSCFAQVHLTWKYERDPSWPSTEVFSSIEEWKTFLIEDELDYHAH
jgi:hypothetical protein